MFGSLLREKYASKMRKIRFVIRNTIDAKLSSYKTMHRINHAKLIRRVLIQMLIRYVRGHRERRERGIMNEDQRWLTLLTSGLLTSCANSVADCFSWLLLLCSWPLLGSFSQWSLTSSTPASSFIIEAPWIFCVRHLLPERHNNTVIAQTALCSNGRDNTFTVSNKPWQLEQIAPQ